MPCRKCGITDELCLCAAKAYIRELEAKIEKLEDDDKPPKDAFQAGHVDDLCKCRHIRRAHSHGTSDNNFNTKCVVDGCGCEGFFRIDDEAAWKTIRQFLGDAAAQHQVPEQLADRIIHMVKFYSAKGDEYFAIIQKLKAHETEKSKAADSGCTNPNCSLPRDHKNHIETPVCDDEK